jgi:hypothetical protein
MHVWSLSFPLWKRIDLLPGRLSAIGVFAGAHGYADANQWPSMHDARRAWPGPRGLVVPARPLGTQGSCRAQPPRWRACVRSLPSARVRARWRRHERAGQLWGLRSWRRPRGCRSMTPASSACRLPRLLWHAARAISQQHRARRVGGKDTTL